MSTPWDITPSCKVLSIALNKNYNVVVKIWKAFSLLLELSCKIDHTMVLNQIVRAGDLRVEEVRDSFTQRVEGIFKELIIRLAKPEFHFEGGEQQLDYIY